MYRIGKLAGVACLVVAIGFVSYGVVATFGETKSSVEQRNQEGFSRNYLLKENDKEKNSEVDSNSNGTDENNEPTATSNSEAKVTKVSFKKKTVSLSPEKMVCVFPEILEKDAKYQSITWKVDHKEYASVNKKGEVTLKKKGAGKKVKVTATVHYVENDKKKTISASYVILGEQPVRAVKLESKKNYLLVGKKSKLIATIKPQNATTKTLTWTSNNTKYATVSKKGVVTAKAAGTGKVVKLTAKTTDGSKIKKSITLRILNPKKPMVALTFDDGPRVASTLRIYNKLKEYNARATFFTVGVQLQSKDAQKLVAKSAKYGNEIASHTYHHKKLTSLSFAGVQKESKDTDALIKKITGFNPALTRPPYGSYNNTVKGAISTPLILWSIDTLDWKTRNASKTISCVMGNIKDGDIVLMHDFYDTTAEAAEAIIPQLAKKEYQMVTVSELAEIKKVKLTKGNTYSSIR